MTEPSAPTFAGLPCCGVTDLDHATIAILSAREGSPYTPERPSHSAGAPVAIREASQLFARRLQQIDLDIGAVAFPEQGNYRGVWDCGEIPTTPGDARGNRAAIERATRSAIEAGATPILIGGDDSVPIPFLEGFGDAGPLTVVHLDAHVDWADVINGNPYGFGSTMRRVSELPNVAGMVQIGMRGIGSGDPAYLSDAKRWGSRIVTSRHFRKAASAAFLDDLPQTGQYVLAIDLDCLDPALFPAVNLPTPGGLCYDDILEICEVLSSRGRIIGCAVVEYVPERDNQNRDCALMAARIIHTVIGQVLLSHGA